jgi:hypothetical protein
LITHSQFFCFLLHNFNWVGWSDWVFLATCCFGNKRKMMMPQIFQMIVY